MKRSIWLFILFIFSLLTIDSALAQPTISIKHLSALHNVAKASATRQPAAPLRDDSQVWSELQLIKKLTPKHDLVIIGVVRVGRDVTRPVDERIGAGLAFKINPYLTITPTYLHVEQQPSPGVCISEDRLIMNVTGKVTMKKFTFTDRNLIERRVRYNTPDFTVYRNRLQIDYPIRIGEFEFKPFVADEAWYSSQTRSNGQENFGWFRNRISAGIIRKFTENFTGEFYYLYQHDGVAKPGNVSVLGTLLRYTF